MANKVIVRLKPAGNGNRPEWEVIGENKLTQDSKDVFAVDSVCPGDKSHADLYSSHISEALACVTQGFDVTILAYGLPKSGKTFNMMGTPGQVKSNQEAAKGIITRCMDQLVQLLVQGNNKTVSRVTGSYCLILADGRVNDLLDVRKRNLKVEETPPVANGKEEGTKRYHINGCTQEKLKSSEDITRLTGKANIMRNATGVVQQSMLSKPAVDGSKGRGSGGIVMVTNPLTRYKPHSSHAVFQYNIEHISDTSVSADDPQAIASTITLIDMAGYPIEQYCNDSTSNDIGVNALHQVLDLISNGKIKEASTVAKSASLTRLLYSSLFGNAKCLLVSTLSMDDSSPFSKKALEFSLAFKNAPNDPSPIIVSSSTLSIGRTIQELNTLKSALIKKCTGLNNTELRVKPNGYHSVQINGENYEDLDHESAGILKKYVDLQDMLIGYGDGLINNKPTLHSPPKLKGPAAALRPPTLIIPPPFITTSTPTDAPLSGLRPPSGTSLSARPIVSPSPQSSSSLTLHPRANSPTAGLKLRPLASPTQSPLPFLSVPTLLQSPPPGATSSIITSPVKQLPQLRGPSPDPTVMPNSKLTVTSKNQDKSSEEISSSDSEDEQEKLKKQTGTNNSIPAPPPLNAIPHVKPQPTPPSTVHSTGSQSSTPRTSLTQVDGSSVTPATNKTSVNSNDRNNVNSKSSLANTNQQKESKKTDTGGYPSNNTSSTSSLSSVTSHPSKPQKKKKMRKKRSQSSLSKVSEKIISPLLHSQKPSEQNNSSSNSQSADEDTFDPNFRPGKLAMTPNSVNPFASHSNQLSPAAAQLSLPIPIQQQFIHQPRQQEAVMATGYQHHYNPATLYGNNTNLLPLPTSLLQGSPSRPYGVVPVRQDDDQQHAYQQQMPLIHKPFLPPLRSLPLSAAQNHGDYQNEHDQFEDPQPMKIEHEIHAAAMYGVKVSYLKELVMQHGVDFMDDYKRTPLMFAVKGNQPKMCEVLLSCNANVNATDISGDTPILWATIDANVKIMKILLRAEANITKCTTKGCSVFHWAMRTTNINCLKMLCKYKTHGMENKPDHEGVTPLHYAVTTEQPGHIKVFLNLFPSVQVNSIDSKGSTPLNYAVLNYSPNCIQALIEGRGSEPVQYKDQNGRTPLHYACAEGSADCIRMLTLCKGCNIHEQDNDGRTPLHWAAASGQSGIIQLLLRRNADRGQTDKNGQTALDYAQERNHYECVKVLQNFGLRRPSSAWSVASQFSVRPSTPPELDRTGHVSMKRPRSSKRILSLFSRSTTDRSPGDGGDSEPSITDGQGLSTDGGSEVQKDTNTQRDSSGQPSSSSHVTDPPSIGDTVVTNTSGSGDHQQHQQPNSNSDTTTTGQESVDGDDLTPVGEPSTDQKQQQKAISSTDHERESVSEAAGGNNALKETQTTTVPPSVDSERQSSNRSLFELFRSCIPRRNNTVHPNMVTV